jgi:hypothetical protein
MELEISEINSTFNNNKPEIIILNNIDNNNNNYNCNNINNFKQKPVSSYDDILSKMGMVVENGKISLTNQKKQVSFSDKCEINKESCKIKCSKLQQTIKQQQQQQIPISPLITDNKNSYIYNKYFKNKKYDNQSELEQQEQIPLTKEQIIQKLIQIKLQRQRIKQIKSTKLVMPTENIHYAPENNFNRLFGFSNR